MSSGGWLTWTRPSGARLGVSPLAVDEMLRFRQDDDEKLEAGGILLGRRLLDSEDVVVDQVTTPFPSDVRKRFVFIRREQGHQEAVNQAWQESGGTTVYLGEWHTHAEPTPQPSGRDIRGWQQKEGEVSADGLFFVIFGIDTAGAWEMWEAEHGLAQLTRETSD